MRGVIAGITSALLLCATGSGQATSGPPLTRKAPQQPSATDIYEVVLRYQIKSWDLNAESYCVEVEGKDATRDLLERLKPLRVKAASGCRRRKNPPTMQVVDKKTGKMSVVFDMGEIQWRSQSNADVDGGYVCGGLCAAGGTYHVRWDGNGWVVTNFEIRVQS